jgi:hypothetical protein
LFAPIDTRVISGTELSVDDSWAIGAEIGGSAGDANLDGMFGGSTEQLLAYKFGAKALKFSLQAICSCCSLSVSSSSISAICSWFWSANSLNSLAVLSIKSMAALDWSIWSVSLPTWNNSSQIACRSLAIISALFGLTGQA